MELDVEAGHKAARLAALNALAVTRHHLGPLDKVTRIVRLGVSVATLGDVREQPKVADDAYRVTASRFRKREKTHPAVDAVTILPLGVPVELELIFESWKRRVRSQELQTSSNGIDSSHPHPARMARHSLRWNAPKFGVAPHR